jgi:hypothetical protein
MEIFMIKKFIIEKGIPIPESKGKGASLTEWIDFYNQLNPGDSFLCTEANLNGFKVALKKYGIFPPRSVLIASKVGPNQFRVWRKRS